jgi:DNA repair protein RadC
MDIGAPVRYVGSSADLVGVSGIVLGFDPARDRVLVDFPESRGARQVYVERGEIRDVSEAAEAPRSGVTEVWLDGDWWAARTGPSDAYSYREDAYRVRGGDTEDEIPKWLHAALVRDGYPEPFTLITADQASRTRSLYKNPIVSRAIVWELVDGHYEGKGQSGATYWIVPTIGKYGGRPVFVVYRVHEEGGKIRRERIGDHFEHDRAMRIADEIDIVGESGSTVGSAAEDFPSLADAVKAGGRRPAGQSVYFEAGKYHLAKSDLAPPGALPLTPPGKTVRAEEVVPVLHENPSVDWPAPEAVEAKEAVAEDSCVPWVKVTRDTKQYDACVARARSLGPVDSPESVWELLHDAFAKEDQEVFVVILLDVRFQLRGVAEVARGQRSKVNVGVEDVMRAVIVSGAETFVVCHNHPSTDVTPSPSDKDLTRQIERATSVFGKGLYLLDHCIIGTDAVYSIKEKKKYKMKK